VRRYLASLSSFFAWAVRERLKEREIELVSCSGVLNAIANELHEQALVHVSKMGFGKVHSSMWLGSVPSGSVQASMSVLVVRYSQASRESRLAAASRR
jgi:hypothetical protein